MQSNSPGTLLKNFISSRSVLNRLIVINTAIFLIVNIINIIYRLSNIQPVTEICNTRLNEIIYFMALPAELSYIISRPWTVFTYMFLHEQLFHAFFNMFFLYVGGQLFVYFIGEKKLLSVYLMGGFMGAIFYITAFNIFPGFIISKSCSIAIGASASVLAVFIAIATYAPNYSISLFLIGRIPLKYVALIFIIIDIVSIDGNNPGGSIAHLGGALWGFLFALQFKKNAKGFFHIDFSRFLRLFKRKRAKMHISYSEKPHRPMSDEAYNRTRANKQKKIDAILDKISKSGYKSLTTEEKEFLFKYSNKE